MREHLAQLLQELSLIDALPGHEQAVVRYLKEKWTPYAEQVNVGINGNIYARKVGRKQGHSVAVSAHMDEIGLVVRDIDPSGMIRFDKLGWFSDSWLPGTRVRVGNIPGMVGIKSGHLMTEEEKRSVLPHRNLYIDIGAKNAAEIEKWGICIGDPIGFEVPFGRWNDADFCCGKAMDNRAAVAVLTVLLEKLNEGDFPGTFWAVGTVQEERGLAGARTAAQFTRPDWFMALDVALSGDTPESPASSHPIRLGGGAVLSLGDFLESPKRGYFIHPGLKAAAKRAARDKGIALQVQAMYGNSYTDAAAVAQEGSGIPCLSVGIPIRYSHAPSSVCHLGDMQACLDLAEALVRQGMEQKDFAFLQEGGNRT